MAKSTCHKICSLLRPEHPPYIWRATYIWHTSLQKKILLFARRKMLISNMVIADSVRLLPLFFFLILPPPFPLLRESDRYFLFFFFSCNLCSGLLSLASDRNSLLSQFYIFFDHNWNGYSAWSDRDRTDNNSRWFLNFPGLFSPPNFFVTFEPFPLAGLRFFFFYRFFKRSSDLRIKKF